MKKQKCEDCHNETTLSRKFMDELTLNRLVAFIIIVVGVAYGLGAGSVKLYSSIDQTATNKVIIDSILVKVDKLSNTVVMLDSNTRSISNFLKNGGHIPENLAFKKIDSTVFYAKAIYPKKKQQRTCYEGLSLSTEEKKFLSTIEKEFKN